MCGRQYGLNKEVSEVLVLPIYSKKVGGTLREPSPGVKCHGYDEEDSHHPGKKRSYESRRMYKHIDTLILLKVYFHLSVPQKQYQ